MWSPWSRGSAFASLTGGLGSIPGGGTFLQKVPFTLLFTKDFSIFLRVVGSNPIIS